MIDFRAVIGEGLRAHQVAPERARELLTHENPNAALGAANSIARQ